MAQTSNSIGSNIQSLLSRVTINDIKAISGFIRGIDDKLNIPIDIINYCVIYAFLRINQWYKGTDEYWKIDESKLKAECNDHTNQSLTK